MTLDEFFEKLPRDGWFLDRWGEIRTRRNGCLDCPQLAVADGTEPGPFNGTWGPIWRAADNKAGHDPALRARLLAHCGLEK